MNLIDNLTRNDDKTTDWFAVALKLLTLGFSILPSGGGKSGKSPLVSWRKYQEERPTEDDLIEWENTYHPALWGVVTGRISGVVVVDADTPEAREKLEAMQLQPHVLTPRGGAHFYFKYPGFAVKTIAGLLPGIDIRGDGGFINVVGKRADGEYQVLRLPTPQNIYPWELLPEEIRNVLGKKRKNLPATELRVVPEGQRNTYLASLAGTMRRRAMPLEAIEAALLECNRKLCAPPLPEEEVSRIARSIAKYPADAEAGHPLQSVPSIEEIKKIIGENFPESEGIWTATDACLSVFGALLLKDLSHPIGLNLQDCPSSWKSTILDFFEVPGLTYHSDHFTPRSFVTHAANVRREELESIDLLPRIRNKVLIIPELAPLFGVRKEDLLENIAILTRLFDGEGLLTDSGIRGRRGYRGEYLFGWLGATTPLPDSVWYMLGKLGTRWLFFSIDSDELTEEQMVNMMNSTLSYKEKVKKCRIAVSSFLTELFRQHPLSSIEWDPSGDGVDLLSVIARLGDLVRRFRGTIASWNEGVEHTPPIIEYPPRVVMLLYNFSRGHAIVHGRRNLNEEDIWLAAQVAFSSMPDARRRILKNLIEEVELKTRDVMDILRVSRPTALKIMRTLGTLGAVDIYEDEDDKRENVTIFLRERDEWLANDRFAWLHQKLPPSGAEKVATLPEENRHCVNGPGYCSIRDGARHVSCALKPEDCGFWEEDEIEKFLKAFKK